MTGRERVRAALEHREADRPPIDMGATPVSGISASALHRLRQALGLGGVVKVHEPFQILGLVEDDVRQALGIDTIALMTKGTMFGFDNDGWKPWRLQDGTEVLISKNFHYTLDENGDTLVYPKGDRSAPPSGRLPKGGYYFDAIVRQQPLDENKLDPREWDEQFALFGEAELNYLQKTADEFYRNTSYSLSGNFWQGGLGDIAHVPGPGLTNPKGLRDPNLWYEYLITHTDYIKSIFERQTEVALKNLKLYHQAVGDRVDVLKMSGTDFGTQRGPICSPDLFRELWRPLYRKLNDWVHRNTKWKVFFHTCGGIRPIIPDLIEVGVDVLNPVQCSAVGMDAAELKREFGDKLVFWGGGVDTQKTLPFGSVEEVRRQVKERLDIFAPGGGFVFNTIHNIQQGTPPENIIAMFETVRNWKP